MMELAKAAGFSQATPYNLFGSKAEVLREVFMQEVRGFHRSIAPSRHLGPVVYVACVADLLVTEFTRRPHFYRALAQSLRELGSEGSYTMFLPLAQGLFTPLADELTETHTLQSWIAAPLLIAQLNRILEGVVSSWIILRWSREKLLLELQLGLGLAMLGCLTPSWQTAMTEALRPLAEELRAHEAGHGSTTAAAAWKQSRL